MTLEKLYKMAESSNIPVVDIPLKGISAMAACINGKYAIAIDYTQVSSPEDEKVKLAHELGHCITNSLYAHDAPHDYIRKQEAIAKEWALNLLLPKDEMEEALKEGCVEVWQLAEHFGVPEKYVETALQLHFNNSVSI